MLNFVVIRNLEFGKITSTRRSNVTLLRRVDVIFECDKFPFNILFKIGSNRQNFEGNSFNLLEVLAERNMLFLAVRRFLEFLFDFGWHSSRSLRLRLAFLFDFEEEWHSSRSLRLRLEFLFDFGWHSSRSLRLRLEECHSSRSLQEFLEEFLFDFGWHSSRSLHSSSASGFQTNTFFGFLLREIPRTRKICDIRISILWIKFCPNFIILVFLES